MDSIHIEATDSTPAIKFGADGKLVIEGRSLRLYVNEFYNPLIDWVKALRLENVTIDINLEYVDTGCSVLLYQLLKELDSNTSIKRLIVNWHYEEVDYDTLDDGMILKGILKKAEFKFHEHPETYCII
ncbi:MAG: SiaC family regulatory phosphoprotein [Bacteroidales bacterium]